MYIITIYIHIICVALWIGGQLFLPLVLIPALKKSVSHPFIRKSIIIETGIVFSKVGRWLLVLFIFTGIGNYYFKFRSWNFGIISSTDYGTWLLIKILMFLCMAGINFYHEQKIGLLMTSDLSDAAYNMLRRKAIFTGRITLILSLIIAFIGLYLTK